MKTSLITVAGIVLKGQADLISIMVPLEVLVKQKKMKKKKTGKYCSCYQYKTRFVGQKHGWERRGRILVKDVYVIFLFLYIFGKNFL